MAKVLVNDTTLTSIADAIRTKNGLTETYKPAEMPTAILAIEGGGADLPEEAFVITGNCNYRFAHNGWNWFIEEYGDKITTEGITGASYMFYDSISLKNIPFDLNFNKNNSYSLKDMFSVCNSLLNIPKMDAKVSSADEIFSACRALRELKEESVANLDWSEVDNATSGYSASRANTFKNCHSLRKYPNSFLAHGNPKASNTYTVYYGLFDSCYSLDEVVDLPIVHANASLTSNAFRNIFYYCSRLKRFTFATNEDGTPYKIDTWKNQSIELQSAGSTWTSDQLRDITNRNSGITEDKYVGNAEDYQALKDDLDWYTDKVEYSRYNHDSAVETINSLPDLSGGAGGNTIKFTGNAGGATDGGAINTLTEEEIAVAAAKGWTVTLV